MSIEELAQGTWNMEKSENFDDYMKALGVGTGTRFIANKLKPTQEIKIEDGEWTIKTVSTFKSGEVKFKPGVPFEETTADGRTVQTTFTIEGTKLIQEQKGTPDSGSVRDFSQDTFTMTLNVKDVIAKRFYKKAP